MESGGIGSGIRWKQHVPGVGNPEGPICNKPLRSNATSKFSAVNGWQDAKKRPRDTCLLYRAASSFVTMSSAASGIQSLFDWFELSDFLSKR